jgi:hypothetical protein
MAVASVEMRRIFQTLQHNAVARLEQQSKAGDGDSSAIPFLSIKKNDGR